MPGTLTKSDVKFDSFRLSREIELQENGTKVTKWYVNIGYKVVTAEGEEFNRDKQIELTGAQLNAAKNFLTTLYNQVKAEEGIGINP